MRFVINSLLICAFLVSTISFAQNNARTLGYKDYRRTQEYYSECMTLKKFVTDSKYQTRCYMNYHHFNVGAQKFYNPSASSEWIKISTFNLLHPGSSFSFYKDFALVAKLMNKYDLVAASELLGAVGKDREHNQRVKRFLQDAPIKIKDIEHRLLTESRRYLMDRVAELRSDYKKAPSLYRAPGYLNILDELRKLDPSWSLILAPSGEAADDSFVQEMVGFYYRGRNVQPKINEHCDKFKKSYHGLPVACYPKLTKAWAGKSVREVFSRRPFLASFESGDFDFTLLTSHIVYRGASDPYLMERILQPSFGVDNYLELGSGATKANFARLAEMKIIAEIMQKIREESNEKDIIFLGDTNLDYHNEQWSAILDAFPGGELFVKEATTLTMPLTLSDGTITKGTANSYDHIIMDLQETRECVKDNGSLSARVDNFIQGHFADLIHRKYLFRFPNRSEANPQFQNKRQGLIEKLRRSLDSRLTIKRNKIVPDNTDTEELLMNFDARVFLSQIFDETYYKVYREVISDHFPIYFSCRR